MIGSANSVAMVLDPLTISLNGTKALDYNGLTPKTLNITAASVGAATSSHTHNSIRPSITVSQCQSATLRYYTKIMTLKITQQFTSCAACFKICEASHGLSTNGFSELFIWVKQQDELGKAPLISLSINRANSVKNRVKHYAVLVEMTEDYSLVDIYAQMLNTYSANLYFLISYHIPSNTSKLTFHSNSNYIESIPEPKLAVIEEVDETARHSHPDYPSTLIYKNISIPVASWDTTNKTYTYSNTSITANHSPEVRFAAASISIAFESDITVYTEAGKLILKCEKNIPTAALVIDAAILTLIV